MPYGPMTERAVVSCNAACKDELTPKKLVDLLSGTATPEGWIGYLDVFFNELQERTIRGVMEENNLTLDQLKAVFASLPKAVQGRRFKALAAQN